MGIVCRDISWVISCDETSSMFAKNSMGVHASWSNLMLAGLQQLATSKKLSLRSLSLTIYKSLAECPSTRGILWCIGCPKLWPSFPLLLTYAWRGETPHPSLRCSESDNHFWAFQSLSSWRIDCVLQEEGYVTADVAEQKNLHQLKLSGTKFRQLLRAGEDIPDWFAFKSVVDVLRQAAAEDNWDLYDMTLSALQYYSLLIDLRLRSPTDYR